MLAPLFVWPLAAQLIAVADGVPKFDVTPSCRGAAKSGYISTEESRLKSCIDSEMQTRKKLEEEWSKYPAVDRSDCYTSIRHFNPTYVELATCLEMKRDLRDRKTPDTVNAPTMKPASRR